MDIPVWIGPILSLLILATALGTAWVSRGGRAMVRRAAASAPLAPGITIFTSRTCSTCDALRARLGEIGVDFVEVSYEEQPGDFSQAAVTEVPTFFSVSADGSGWFVRGLPTRRQLRRWLDDAVPSAPIE